MASPAHSQTVDAPFDVGQIRVPKTAELVASAIRRQIVRRDLQEGDALPPEAELIIQFGVSRPTLREAFRVLESESLLDVRRGARGGARVVAPNGDVAARFMGLVLEYRNTALADVLEARELIEAPMAGILAKKRTAADLEVLRAAVEGAEADYPDWQAMPARHSEFHTVMIELGGNRTLGVLSGMLTHIVELATESWLSAAGGSEDERRGTMQVTKAHRRLVELIAERDAEQAEAFWREHLAEAGRYLLKRVGPKSVLEIIG